MRIAAIVLSISLTACAALRDEPGELRVSSEPAGARVVIDGVTAGFTPVAIRVPRRSHDRVTVQKKGYRTATLVLDKPTDSTPRSDASHVYTPGHYHVVLSRLIGPLSLRRSILMDVRTFVLDFGPDLRAQLAGEPGDAVHGLKAMLRKMGAVIDDGVLEQLARNSASDPELADNIIRHFELGD